MDTTTQEKQAMTRANHEQQQNQEPAQNSGSAMGEKSNQASGVKESTMETIVIEGTFARMGTDNWVIDAPELHTGFWPVHTATGAATAIKWDDGSVRIIDLFISREAAERSLCPEYRAAMDEAKRRSCAHWD